MTDKRKDEMPELKAFRPLPDIRKDEAVTLDYDDVQRINNTFVNYVRMLQENYQTVSPPVPNDVAEACKRLERHNKWRRGEEGYEKMCNPRQLGKDIETLIRAASTPDAGLVEALKTISKDSDLNEWTNEFEPSRAAKIAREALAKLEGK